jgi:hypothetical protein
VKAQYAVCKAYVQMAYNDEKLEPRLDAEMAKLRRRDARLAKEIVEYRKNYGGIRATVYDFNK